MELIEGVVDNVMTNVLKLEKHNIPHIAFVDAMNVYGSDKPDMRFEFFLQDFSRVFRQSEFKVFQDSIASGNVLKGLVLKGQADQFTRKTIDKYTDLVKKYGLNGLVVLKNEESGLTGSAAKFISDAEYEALKVEYDLEVNDVIFIGTGEWETACTAIGALRLALAETFDMIPNDKFAYCWVVDFPMFEMSDEDTLVARHHPFTAPLEAHIPLLDTDPLAVTAQAYDLVLNGYEIAGGSMRIYDQDLQEKMFGLIGFTPEEIQNRFGFFVDAFQYGTPPHGGIAFGLDRFAMALTHSDTIRDVIAFPKNASARCPLTNAPSLATEKQLHDLHLKIEPKNKDKK